MRITVQSVILTLLLTTAVYLLIMTFVQRSASNELTKRLAREGRHIVTSIRLGQLTPVLVTSEDVQAQIIGADGRVIAYTPRMWRRPPVAFGRPGPDDDRLDGRSCHIDAPGGPCFQVVAFRVEREVGPSTIYTLAPAVGLVPRPDLAILFAAGIPALTLLVGYWTWWSVGRGLRPVEAIRRDMDEITATDLERRVPVPDEHNEVHDLARSVNATLDRLEEAIAKQRAFVLDVSHELRSPLTGLRTELELALSDPDDAGVRETLAAMLKNIDRLQAVVDDLLALARLDAAQYEHTETVDLHELADQEVLRRPRRSRVRVEADGPVRVEGGRTALARALTNLIDNADRHAESNVLVRVAQEDGDATVEVVDDGTGVLPEDRERIFERFARLSDGRHRDAGGTGLGLAIAREISTQHRGSLTITDRGDGEPGARFVLRLPLRRG
ncbi:sensor histidine kinase [Actinomadura hibisca]|uniref:sensor histidine kinase n=1 Tax=Actinomadura hibisca TaxID=68565 RepID=UPI000A6CAAF3|nr:ATP-binding protein [Actinomadura hibisca]